MELFFDPIPLEKTSSAESALSEDPSTWPYEILQEVYKQAPFIADFAPHVVLDRTDDERGYAFGHIDVTNQTEIQHGTERDAAAAAGVRTVRIPIVIRERSLQPLDLIVTEASEMLPLTEMRLRSALFRPQNFDVTSKTPGDMSLIGSLFPPYRSNHGFGGGGGMAMSAGMGKEGEAPLALLSAILPTVGERERNAVFAELSDPRLEAALTKNAAMRQAIALLRSAPVTPRGKLAAAAVDQIRPDVVQLVRVGNGGYQLKSAAARFWAVRSEHLSRPEALERLGEKIVLAADLSGSATLVPEGPELPAEEPELVPELVSDFGVYRVEDLHGRILVGHVFPNLLDVDGTELPVALFANGSEAAVQGEIFGEPADEEIPLAEGHPKGHGCFYRPEGEASIPLTIHATLSDSGDVSFAAETFDGRAVDVHVSPNLARIVGGDGTMLVPSDMRWLPLDDAQTVVLASGPTKTAAANRYLDSVMIRGGGDGTFSLGGQPVEKIASEARSFLSVDDALLVLGGLGIPPGRAATKLAEALSGHHPVPIRVPRALEPASHAYTEARKLAERKLSSGLTPGPLLLKEGAAAIPDPVAVDTVLSLNFLNAENLETFTTYLPHLDQGQKHMCELLLSARLGLSELPVSALERAIRSTEDVIAGLKVIAFHAGDA